ncbi:MAG: hypothetical protein IJ222_04700 [Bacteroidales bacterium]|nr:hypothetical protein [Bacteroidales bacterium]
MEKVIAEIKTRIAAARWHIFVPITQIDAMTTPTVPDTSNDYTGTIQNPHPGTLSIKKALISGYEISFPENRYKLYKLRYTKEPDRRIAEWIHKEWEHLCWTDFHYIQPPDYNGYTPETLDELCHSVVSGHDRTFSKVLEDSLLSLGFISRPCVCSDKLYDPYGHGARFSYGKYCSGYDFYARSNLFPLIVAVSRTPKLNPMRGISLCKNV